MEAPARRLGRAELKTLGQHDARSVRRSCHGVLDRLDAQLEYARDQEMTRAALDVAMERQLREDGVELLGDGRAIDVEHGRRLLLLAAENGEESVTLGLACALIDDALHHAAAFMDGTWPAIACADDEAVEAHVAEPAFVDALGFQALTIAVRRKRIELARAAVAATTGSDLRVL